MIDPRIKKMLLESKTDDEFKDKFITVYDPSKNLNHDQFSEMTNYIDQDIIASLFWIGRKVNKKRKI